MDTFTMRSPCARCGGTGGHAVDKGGQDVVYCATCSTYAYCRPKAESGRPQRSVRTRPEIKPSTKTRILEQYGHRCVACGNGEATLHIGHLISVDAYKRFGEQVGMGEAEVWADENLVAMCEECNLGMGNTVASVSLMLRAQRMRRLAS